MSTLSVCIIAKNEEKNISRCLNSLSSAADEIIVVDTGSTDSTVEICEKFGAKVLYHNWNNDFSEARNISLEHATMDWILFLDADEALLPEESHSFKELLSTSTKEGHFLKLSNRIGEDIVSTNYILRLVKNKKEYRFKGRIHEQIAYSITDIHGYESIAPCEINIHHYGYDPQYADIDKKNKRNLDLLLSCTEEEKNGYYYYVLGNEYIRLNDYDKAIETYYLGIKENESDYQYYTHLILNLIKSLYKSSRFGETLDEIGKFKKTYSDFKGLYFFESLCFEQCKKYSLAKESMEKFNSLSENIKKYPGYNYNSMADITTTYNSILANCIFTEKSLLSICVFDNSNESDLQNCILNINEISDEVFVILPNNIESKKSICKNLYTKPIILSNKNKNSPIDFILKKSSSQWILFIKSNEICSKETLKDMVKLISETKQKYFKIDINSLNGENTNKEFRLIKNILNKIGSLDKYEQKLSKSNKPIMDSNLTFNTSNK